MSVGLVLEGGASRGAFTAGALDALLDNRIFIPYVIGVSAGISNGMSYVSNQPGRNMEIFRKYLNDPRYIGKRNLINPFNRSLYGIKFAFETIPQKLVPFDFEAYKAFPGTVLAGVTDICTGRPEYMYIDPKDKKLTVLKASCALPLAFPVIKIGGRPYMDGGITDPIPVLKALGDGNRGAVVVLTRHKGYIKEKERALDIAARLYWRYPKFCEALRHRTEVYNQSLDEVERLEKQGRILVIRPDDTTGFGRFERDMEKITGLYREGYGAVSEKADQIREFIRACE